jgi:hypothetical protein
MGVCPSVLTDRVISVPTSATRALKTVELMVVPETTG